MAVPEVFRDAPDRIDLVYVVVDIPDDRINRLPDHFLPFFGNKNVGLDREQQPVGLNQDLLDVAFHHDVVIDRLAIHFIDQHID